MAEFRRWKLSVDSCGVVSKKSASDPPGYRHVGAKELESSKSTSAVQKTSDVLKRKQTALMQKAMQPAKQAGFMCFMLYMSGNTLQVFSIMMLVSCIYSPVAAILNVAKSFPKDDDSRLNVFLPRLAYCAVQMGQLIFAFYKLNTLGLLPTYASDWISTLEAPVATEYSSGAVL